MWRTVVRRVIVYTDMWIGTIWKSDFSVSINIRSLFFFILVLVRVQYINVCRKCLTLQRFFDDTDEIQFEHTVRIMKFYTNTYKIHWQTYQKLVFSSFIFVVVVVIRLVFVFGAIAIRGEQWILFCSSSKWIVVTAFLQFYARLARCIPWKLRNIECVFFRRSFAMQKKNAVCSAVEDSIRYFQCISAPNAFHLRSRSLLHLIIEYSAVEKFMLHSNVSMDMKLPHINIHHWTLNIRFRWEFPTCCGFSFCILLSYLSSQQ